jgi:transposase
MQIKTGAWRRDPAGLQQRRLEAARMFACGATQAEVARTFGVSRQAASVWYRQWHHGGESALRGAGRVGRPPRLSRAELGAVEQALRLGPQVFGFDTQLWTLRRVAVVIERLVGVRFQSRPCVAPAAPARLERTATHPPRHPARSGRDRPLARPGMAPDQGGRLSGTRGSASWTSPASRCGHRSGAPGRHAGRPPSCATTATGSGRPWPGSAATRLTGRGRDCASTPNPTAITTTP